jgi:hypothetical protein
MSIGKESSETQPDADHAEVETPKEVPVPASQTWRLTWITTWSASSHALRYQRLHLPMSEFQDLTRTRSSEDYSLHEALEELNTAQHRIILDHVSKVGATLVFADVWKKERVPTVFGKLEMAFPFWTVSTNANVPIFGPSEEQVEETKTEWIPKDADEELEEVEYEETVEVVNEEIEAPVVGFLDAIGRKFVFPYELVKTWKVSAVTGDTSKAVNHLTSRLVNKQIKY